MELNEMINLSDRFNRIPVFDIMTGDFLTPVSAFLKLKQNRTNCFLFESVEGIGTFARFSFIGIEPVKIFSNNGNDLKMRQNGIEETSEENIFNFLKKEMSSITAPCFNELPHFTGGIVGYLGFENISLIEDSIHFTSRKNLSFPDSIFGVYDTIIAFDHLKHQIIIIVNIVADDKEKLELNYSNALRKIKEIRDELLSPIDYKSDFELGNSDDENDKNSFLSLVDKAKENIYNGDVFQLVLSKRFSSKFKGDLINVYRALRIINPSPYMYYMEFNNDLVIIGTSPEDLLKVRDGKATILPIAGTRKRGLDQAEDKKLSSELLNDPKEIAEHTMLVDLARNDLGRVCKFGSVQITEEMKVHYFSHVMHLVSRVEGILGDNKDCIDALKASFPAGTVTGAPKIRAIQLINEYETIKRGVYAGAVGYIDFTGNLDMCIAIRTLFANGKEIFWQSGAGIVADSIPQTELKEVENKSAVLINALKFAGVIDENPYN